jgi:hypothetical protein
VATPDDWGAGPPVPEKPIVLEPAPPLPEGPSALAFGKPTADKPARTPKNKPGAPKSADAKTAARIADEYIAASWRKVRGGLLWVLFALFFLTLPGFIGFGKVIAPRAGLDLPKDEPGWVIPGYVNTEDRGAVRMKKGEQLDALLYGVPVLLGGLCLSLGRLTCGAAPRNSGAKAIFALSGVLTFIALVGLVTAAACDKLLFKETYHQSAIGFLIAACLAEFWFLNGLTASGLALKRPRSARSVGFVGFFFGLAAFAATLGWEIYVQEWRPKTLDDDLKFYEQGALMLGWLLMIGVYWRAVGSVRGAITEFLQSVEE